MKLISFVILYGAFTISNAQVLACEELPASDFDVLKLGGGRVPCWFCIAAATVGDSWLFRDQEVNPTGLFASAPHLCPDIADLPAGKYLTKKGDLKKYVWKKTDGYGDGNQPNPMVFVNTAPINKKKPVEPVWERQWNRKMQMATGEKVDPCKNKKGALGSSTQSFAQCFYWFDQKATKQNGVVGRAARGAYVNRLHSNGEYYDDDEVHDNYYDEEAEYNLLNEIDSVKQSAYHRGYKNGFTAGVAQAQKRLIRSKPSKRSARKSKYYIH